MIAVEKLTDLEMSAASAIVCDGPHVLAVADDDVHLDAYNLATGRRGARILLLERSLPLEAKARKASKPDFEALTWLPGGRLLVLGSGSTSRRQTGVLLEPPNSVDGPPRKAREVDLSRLYDGLRERLPDLNIEGAAAIGTTLRLLSRGGAGRENAVIELDLHETLCALDKGDALDSPLVRGVHVAELGFLDGVALGFTDASPLPFAESGGRMAFAAAAEDTDNAYDDGACAGSVVGVLEADGRVVCMERVQGTHKIEGLVVTSSGLLMVADPDDPSQRAPLLVGSLPTWA